MDIGAGLAALNEGLRIVKALGDASREIDKVQLKSNILNLSEQMLEVKASLLEARERIVELEATLKAEIEKASFSANLREYDGFKYKADEDGNRIGRPYCSRCEAVDGLFLLTQNTPGRAEWIYTCPECKTEYIDKDAKKKHNFEPRRIRGVSPLR